MLVRKVVAAPRFAGPQNEAHATPVGRILRARMLFASTLAEVDVVSVGYQNSLVSKYLGGKS